MDAETIQQELRGYIAGQFLGGDARDFNVDTPLFGLGILNSLAVFSVTTFIENRFGVSLPDEAISAENFKDVRTLASLVSRSATGG